MDIHNPFTNGQIKNYLLFYASIVVIMILFFIASTLFNDIKIFDKKTFDVTAQEKEVLPVKKPQHEEAAKKFRLLEKAY